jgi:hypothetical protein
MLHAADLFAQSANWWALDTISEDGSIFGDGDDVQVDSNSARDSREQSPDSFFSASGSSSEVSASSKTSETSKVNVADDNSAQSTNSLSPVSHGGLFSPGQIERYYSKKKMNCESICLFITPVNHANVWFKLKG